MTRGTLRIHLGAAPGIGKAFAMLGGGQRRRDRGTDVVVGFVVDHGRPRTRAALADLEVVPRRRIAHRDATFEEMDLDGVLARRPQVALVVRTSLLDAVGHDLRLPWAAAEGSRRVLRADVTGEDASRGALLPTASTSVGQLDRVVSTLLDLSRLTAGAVAVRLEDRAVQALLPPGTLPRRGDTLIVELAEDLPEVEVRVTDSDPGVPDSDKETVFIPFQRGAPLCPRAGADQEWT